VPVSWVRENCSKSDIQLWAEHQEIESKRFEEQRRKSEHEAEKNRGAGRRQGEAAPSSERVEI